MLWLLFSYYLSLCFSRQFNYVVFCYQVWFLYSRCKPACDSLSFLDLWDDLSHQLYKVSVVIYSNISSAPFLSLPFLNETTNMLDR